ncbi:hypothetical protein [Pseudarthrobacter sp. H2]|uniref:hypothetical protein n=1 Tax=Pseudarthrobacter sp. H2 TaxID=3418415 RepID=UPI003CE9ADB0
MYQRTPELTHGPGDPAAGSRVIGTGSFQPARVLTNDELSRIVETSDEWIRDRVGIQTRRIADTETVADLAIGAQPRRCKAPGWTRTNST